MSDTRAKDSINAGSHGIYEWLSTAKHDLDSLLQLCPEVVLGKHLAVTSLDSSPRLLNDAERSAGWETRHGIAYSPRLKLVDIPPRGWCGGYDEWYVFRTSVDLGQMTPSGQNVFEARLEPGKVQAFVNFNLGLHRNEQKDLAELFWEQMDWIHPESYLADSEYLTFVTLDKSLFAAVRDALSESL